MLNIRVSIASTIDEPNNSYDDCNNNEDRRHYTDADEELLPLLLLALDEDRNLRLLDLLFEKSLVLKTQVADGVTKNWLSVWGCGCVYCAIVVCAYYTARGVDYRSGGVDNWGDAALEVTYDGRDRSRDRRCIDGHRMLIDSRGVLNSRYSRWCDDRRMTWRRTRRD